MTLIAFVGDASTTTTLAVAARYPAVDDPLVVEADRTGGSIAAWLDMPVTPSLSTVVSRLRQNGESVESVRRLIDDLVRSTPSGLRFIPAPIRSIEAARSVDEAEVGALRTIATSHLTALIDVGRRCAADGLNSTLRLAETIVVCHRQEPASDAAAGVRLERTAELVESVAAVGARVVVAVIGDRPFDLDEVSDFVRRAAAPSSIAIVQLADDPLAAAVLAGRAGVSARRFARLPLMRSASKLVETLRAASPWPDGQLQEPAP